jgi:DNA polymerase III epsilon subunit-like protein
MATNRSGATHWNSHLLCAIDIETSGTDPERHDILQICVLPLKPDLTPDSRIIPFYIDMQPQRLFSEVDPMAMRVNKLDWHKLYETALDPWRVAELFEEWWQKLGLPLKKSIIPLAHNYPFEDKWLTNWLGPISMSHYFYQYRDTMALANSINDMADFNNEPWPYPKTNLAYLCSQLKVENINPHDAMGDCLATAECYKKMCQQHRIV